MPGMHQFRCDGALVPMLHPHRVINEGGTDLPMAIRTFHRMVLIMASATKAHYVLGKSA